MVRRLDTDATEPAYVVTDITGPVNVHDSVVVNVTAVELGLGTGGWHVVHWNLARSQWKQPGRGHIMKLRYTSSQLDTGAAEEADGYDAPQSLEGTPVVACLLHSQLAAVAATIKHEAPHLRVVFVMTDSAALPLAISDLTHALRESQLIDATVTTGQAFGGDYEAVNVTSGFGVAKALANADVIIAGPGPGVVGSSTKLGFSGLETVAILDEAERYGGVPVLAVRWSSADPRPRHRGLSHHSATVLERCRPAVRLAVDAERLHSLSAEKRAVAVEIPDVASILAGSGIEVTSMGRSVAQDPGFFALAGAAGVLAAQIASTVDGCKS